MSLNPEARSLAPEAESDLGYSNTQQGLRSKI